MIIPGWGQLIDQVKAPVTRMFDVADGVVVGTVQRNGNNITFTPTNNFTGAARFDYTISDGTLTATVTPPGATAPRAPEFGSFPSCNAPAGKVPASVNPPL